MAVITKELAVAIARKLGAEVQSRPKGRHDLAVVYHESRLVASFGIRRGSQKDLGHDHVPSSIYLRPHDARLLAQCPLSREDWIRALTERGII